MKTILVTGGAGFIGSNFVKLMLEEHSEYKIINIDALTYAGNLENLKDIDGNPNYEFIKVDIRDRKRLKKFSRIMKLHQSLTSLQNLMWIEVLKNQ